MPPVLSVIIPTRNRAEVLQRTVTLLLESGEIADRVQDAEILVVDDGSMLKTATSFSSYLAGLGPAARQRVLFPASPVRPSSGA